jgi:hypothetical protein
MNIDPENLIPFSPQTSPHIQTARQHLDEWVKEFGVIRKDAARRRFAQADFAWFAGRTYPTADESDLQLVADCFAWLFLLDDQLDDGSAGRDLDQVASLKQGLAAILMRPHRSAKAVCANLAVRAPLVMALADLWQRMEGRTTENWRWRFVRHVVAGATAAYWESDNRVRQIVPDEQAYIEKRRHTGAIYICMDLIEVVERIDMPERIYESALFKETLNAACDVVCWTNDVYSLEKEHALGENHNLVSIVEHQRGLTREQALAHVVQAIAAKVQRFIQLEPEVLEKFVEHRDDLTKYLAGMRSWMRGNIDWSSSTKRYIELSAPAEQDESGYLDAGMIFPSASNSADDHRSENL